MEEITVRREGSFVSFTREEEGKKIVVPCRDIRGSMVWPTATSPLYFCVFAQESQPNLKGKMPLVLLAEGEDALPQRFFQKMIEHSRRLWCREFYVDFEKQNRELMTLFSDICRYRRATHIHFARAPFAQNFSFGAGLVQQWAEDDGLEISEGSILRAQLAAMSSSDLAQSPEEKFFAVNALRYLIGSLEKEPWEPPVFTVRAREKRDPRGWT